MAYIVVDSQCPGFIQTNSKIYLERESRSVINNMVL
jgi:hypothetical protein